MGRRSLAPERREQVLDAFEACVVERGLAAASLDRTAERAGLTRQLVLHYFGSRAALVEAALARMVERYRARITSKLGSLSEKERLGAFLDWILGGDFCDPESDALLGELTGPARRDEATRHAIHGVYLGLHEAVASELARAYPAAPPERHPEIAFEIMALCFGSGSLMAVGFPTDHWRGTRAAADTLIRALENPDQ